MSKKDLESRIRVLEHECKKMTARRNLGGAKKVILPRNHQDTIKEPDL